MQNSIFPICTSDINIIDFESLISVVEDKLGTTVGEALRQSYRPPEEVISFLDKLQPSVRSIVQQINETSKKASKAA